MPAYTAENPLKVLSLGWGVQSWTLAAMSALGELPTVDYVIHADTTHEAEGTYSHAAKWAPWLEEHGIPVVTVTGKRMEPVDTSKDIPAVLVPAYTLYQQQDKGQLRRQCTNEWKIKPIRRFIREKVGRLTPGCVESWQGISLDEWQRMRSSDVGYITNLYPLVDRRITRAHCITWLEQHGLDVPPKSACTFCPYHNLNHWRTMKRKGGSDWDRAVVADEAIRNKRPPQELFVHPTCLPLEEAVRIPEDVGAHQLEMEMPCDSGHCFV